MSQINDIADAVALDLSNAALSMPFSAVRMYQPLHDLNELRELRVVVTPRSQTLVQQTRQSDQYDIAIDVGVQMHVDPGDTTRLDGLMSLVDEVVAFLFRRRPATYDTAVPVEVANEPIFAPDVLSKDSVFLSVVTITYRVDR